MHSIDLNFKSMYFLRLIEKEKKNKFKSISLVWKKCFEHIIFSFVAGKVINI